MQQQQNQQKQNPSSSAPTAGVADNFLGGDAGEQQETDSVWMLQKIESLFAANEKLRQEIETERLATYLREREAVQNNNNALEEKVKPWTKAQDRFAEDFLVKCSKRLVLEQESALYYRRRHYWLAVPALILGTIATGTAFSQWSNELLCQKASYIWLLVAFIFAAATVMNGLTDHVFNFKARAARHHSVFKSFSGLIRELSQELSNPLHERKEYRKFMDNIVAQYNHFTDEAELIPRSVTQTVNKMLEEAENQQYERDQHRRHHRTGRYYPQNALPPEYFTPWQKQWQTQKNPWTTQNSSETPTSSSTSPKTNKSTVANSDTDAVRRMRAMEEGRAGTSRFLSARSGPSSTVLGSTVVDVEPRREHQKKQKQTPLVNSVLNVRRNDRDATSPSSSSSSSSSSRNRDFYAEVELPAETRLEIDMPKYDERAEEYVRNEQDFKIGWLYMLQQQREWQHQQQLKQRMQENSLRNAGPLSQNNNDLSEEERIARRRQSLIQLSPFTPRQRDYRVADTELLNEEDLGSVQLRAMARLLPEHGICEDLHKKSQRTAVRQHNSPVSDSVQQEPSAAMSRWKKLRGALVKTATEHTLRKPNTLDEDRKATTTEFARETKRRGKETKEKTDTGVTRESQEFNRDDNKHDTPTPESVTEIARSGVDLSGTGVVGGGLLSSNTNSSNSPSEDDDSENKGVTKDAPRERDSDRERNGASKIRLAKKSKRRKGKNSNRDNSKMEITQKK